MKVNRKHKEGDTMLPATSRPNDIVQVIQEDNKYYGMIGKLVKKYTDKNTKEEMIVVDIYGKEVTFKRSELRMMARVGTNTHDKLTEELEAKNTNHLTVEDYDDLINIAIDLAVASGNKEDWEWAQDLVKRKQELQKRDGE